MLMGFSGTTMAAGFGLLTGFASFAGFAGLGGFARTLVFASGFFLIGVFVAMTGSTPGLNVE